MIRTVYSTLSDAELIQMALMRDTRNELETELAQRLEMATTFVGSLSNDLGIEHMEMGGMFNGTDS